MEEDEQRQRFLTQNGWGTAKHRAITGDASNRRYHRLTHPDGTTAILMEAKADQGEDVRPFIRMADFLRGVPLSAPEIYAAEPDAGLLLIEDFGTDRFAELMQEHPERRLPLYATAADALVKLHQARPLELPKCDANWLLEALSPFFEWYIPKVSTAQTDEIRATFRPLFQEIEQADPVVILRDFHSENLMWLAGRNGTAQVGLLDFQDALLGHPAYDLVSILQDARRDVPQTIETDVKDHLLNRAALPKDAFERAYAVLGVQRNLRILGLFVRLSQVDGKQGYISLIPRVWRYVMRGLAHPALHPVAKQLLGCLPEPTADVLNGFLTHGR